MPRPDLTQKEVGDNASQAIKVLLYAVNAVWLSNSYWVVRQIT